MIPVPSPADSYHGQIRNVLIMCGLMGCVVVVFWAIGKTDRIVYLGARADPMVSGRMLLQTDPAGDYGLPRNAVYDSLRVGCRYDLNYPPTFGRSNRVGPGQRSKDVRSATLVDCPARSAASGS